MLQPFDGDDLSVLARLTAEQLGNGHSLASPSRFWPFVLGIVLTLVVGWGVYLLQKQQQQKHQKENIIAGLQDVDLDTLKQLLGGADLPPWLRFPDVARTQWINSITQCLWPHIDKAACKWAWGNLEQLLNSTDFWRPQWLHTSGVKLHGIVLGHVPPTVTGVKVYGQMQHICREEVSMEFDFSWASKMEVKMVMRVSPEKRFPILGHLISVLAKAITVKVGVRDVVVRGRLRAILRPLVDEIPVVGAVKLSFVEAPIFSHRMTVYGGSPMWLPGLETWVNSFIKTEVLRPYIFPEGFVYRLADVRSADQERPQGLLTLRVVEAVNVPRMDLFSAGDPYVRLYLRQKLRLHTTVKSNTSHPVWEEEFQLLVHDAAHQTLYMSLWDSDVFSSDDKIGAVEVPLSSLDLTPGAMNDLWLPLGGPDGEQKPAGKPWFPWHQGCKEEEPSRVGQPQRAGSKRRWGWRRSRRKQPATQLSRGERVAVEREAVPAATAPPGSVPGVVGAGQAGLQAGEPAGAASPAGAGASSSAGLAVQGGRLGEVPEGSAMGASRSGSSSRLGQPRPELARPVWDSPRQAPAGGGSGVTRGSGIARSSGALGLATERGRQAIGQLGGQGQEALQQMVRVVASALPQRRVCKLHIQASYSPFTQQEIKAASEAGSPAALRRLSTSESRAYQVLRGGVLYIHLNQAQNLAKKSSFFNGGPTKNMRCRVRVGKYEKQTERGKGTNSRNPVFDQTMEFVLDATTATDPNTLILLEVHDINWLFPSDFKGRVIIPLHQVIQRQRLRDVWQLEGVTSGQLDMELEWLGAMGF